MWLGSSLDEVRKWTDEAQRDAGYQLFKVQSGLEPSDWKPMPSVGSGVQELRIHCGNEYRFSIWRNWQRPCMSCMRSRRRHRRRHRQHVMSQANGFEYY